MGVTLTVMTLLGLIVSPALASTFTPITQPNTAYLASTTKIDISGLTYGSSYSSITDGVLTVSFDTPLERLAVPYGWATWSSPPDSESANPDVLYSMGQSDLTMTLGQPCTIFGFELEPNPFSNYDYSVDFIMMSGPTVIGTITMTVNGYFGARLFAAECDGASFDRILINGDMEFAITQVRYKTLGIQVTSPNSGETWTLGSRQNITWVSSGVTGNVNISLSRDGGNSWRDIVSGTPNDGNEPWIVKGPTTNEARIKVVSVSDPNIHDVSDMSFSISAGPSAPNENVEQVKGVDVSSYTGEVPIDSWQHLKAEGLDFVIVGAWGGRAKNNFAKSQLNAARQAELKTAAYALLNFDRANESGSYQVNQALMAIGEEKPYLMFMAIDVENAWPVKVDAIQRIADAVEAVRSAGLTPVIYTHRGAWQSITKNSVAFSNLPLWDTDWDKKGSLQETWRPYGGWTNRTGKQYDHDLWAGQKPWQVWADLDVFNASLFGLTAP
jgi:GH25 family lysozyme M1 (1,4-beta-N-acetylmuramidase)